jgi:aspartate aminotransferase
LTNHLTISPVAKINNIHYFPQGFEILSLCVGEPDFAPPGQIIAAAKDALDAGHTKYTANNGSLELREAICTYLSERKGVSYDPSCILVTNGGSYR